MSTKKEGGAVEVLRPASGDRHLAALDPEVPARAKRRRFTPRYKLEILARADSCTEAGEIGALLRREGLYSSLLSKWRQQRESGALSAIGPQRGRKRKRDAASAELTRLRRENERLRHRLGQAELIIEVQKKVSQILGIPLPPTDSDGSSW